MALVLAALAALAALAEACDVCSGREAGPPNHKGDIVLLDGSFSGCLCDWVFVYSGGPTLGRITINSDLPTDDGATVAVYASSDFSLPLAEFTHPLQDTVLYSSTGVIRVTLSTPAGSAMTSLVADITAINTAPVITVDPDVERYDLFTSEDLIVYWNRETPLPFEAIDYDNFNTQLTVELSLGLGLDTSATIITTRLTVPAVPEVTFLDGEADEPGVRFVLDGPSLAVEAALRATRLTPRHLNEYNDFLTVTISDNGNSGFGTEETSVYQSYVATRCDGLVDVWPENGTLNYGWGRPTVNEHCIFHIHDAFRLDFNFFFFEVRDINDPDYPCYDYLRVIDGDDLETGEILSTEYSPRGEICSLSNQLLPTYSSASGSFMVEMVTDEQVASDFFRAIITGVPSSFSLWFADPSGQLQAASGADLDLDWVVVSRLPGSDIEVRASALRGQLRVRFADSFPDVIDPAAQIPGEVLIAYQDTTRSPLLRVSKLLRQLVYTAPVDFEGLDEVTVSATSSGQEAESLVFSIEIKPVGINIPADISTNAHSLVPLDISISAPGTEVQEVAISTALEASTVSVDPRAVNWIDVGFAPELILRGSVDDVNKQLSHLVYRSPVGGIDTVTISSGDTVRTFDLSVSPQCNGHHILYGSSGSFTDRTGPPNDQFPPGVRCSWELIGSALLSFPFYEMPLLSRLEVFDGLTVELIYQHLLFSTPPNPIVNTNRWLLIYFASDSDRGRGFRGEFRSAENLNDPPLVLAPQDPRNAVRGTTFKLDDMYINDFDAELPLLTCTFSTSGGSLMVGSENVGPLYQVTGSFQDIDDAVTSMYLVAPLEMGLVEIEITAADDEETVGPTIVTVNVIPCDGLVALNLDARDDSVSFSDGSGIDNYSSRLECSWSLTGAPAPAVLDFDFLDLEPLATGGCADGVRIYDGANIDGRLIGEFCSRASIRSSALVSQSGSFFVVLFSDGSNENDGFSASYSSLPSGRADPLGSAPERASPVRTDPSFVALADSSLFVLVGGWNGVRPVLTPLLFSVSSGWLELTSTSPAPAARHMAAAAPMGSDSFVILGGINDLGSRLSDTWLGVVDQVAGEIAWTELLGAPAEAAAGSRAFQHSDGQVYLLAPDMTVWALANIHADWVQVSAGAVPPGRTLPAAALLGNSLYVFGDTATDRTDTWMFTIGPMEWSELAAQPDAARPPACSEACVGFGLGSEFAVLADVGEMWALNTTTATWEAISDSAPVEGVAAVSGVYAGRPAAFTYGGGVLELVTLALDITDVSPRVSPVTGNTLLTITGEQLSTCQNPRCRFPGSQTESEASVLSERMLECRSTVGGETGVVDVLCGTDTDTDTDADTDLYQTDQELFFFTGPAIASVDPLQVRAGDVLSLVLNVPLEILEVAERPMCQFNETSVEGQLAFGEATVTCTVPDSVRGPAALVKVSLDRQQFTGAGIEVRVIGSSSGDDLVVTVVAVAGAILALALLVGVFGVAQYRRTMLYRLAAKSAPWQIPFDQLEIDDVIGTGSFGTVYRGTYRGSQVAIKMLKEGSVTIDMIQAFRKESALMAELRHPNIVLFMGACTIPPNMAIVLEFLAYGSLYDMLHNEMVTFGWHEVRAMALDIVKGMAYLHAAEPPIFHRDLKSLNVLVDKNWTMKVSDFGLTEVFGDDTDKDTGGGGTIHDNSDVEMFMADKQQAVGSVYWMAPELLEGGDFNEACDVYAFGITLWEICTRENPYNGQPPEAVASQVVIAERCYRPPIDSFVPDDLLDIIHRSWEHESSLRPSFKSLKALLSDGDMSSTQQPAGELQSMVSSDMIGAASVPAPTGDVCFAVVGVDSATKLWEWNPWYMRTALRTFHEIKAALAEKFRAYVGSNDRELSVLVFQGVADALKFAVSLQRELLIADWPLMSDEAELHEAVDLVLDNVSQKRLFFGLRARIGLHFGQAETQRDPLTRRRVYEGPALNRAMSVTQACAGGQILVAQHEADQVSDESAAQSDVSTFSLGDVALEDGEMSLAAVYPSEIKERHKLLLVQRMPAKGYSVQSNPAWAIPGDDLQVGEIIGAGSYGSVFKGWWNGTAVAAKMLHRRQLGQAESLDLHMEIGMISSLRHPNVTQFLGVCETQGKIYIVTEFMAGGSLFDALIVNRNRVFVSQKLKCRIARDVGLGVAYLHARKPLPIVHRDLKTKNVLVGENWEVKITDFGLARTKQGNYTMTKVGTGSYMAPEILKGSRYDESADVYSYAMLLWEVLTEEMAYADWMAQNQKKGTGLLVTAIIAGHRPDLPFNPGPMEKYTQLVTACWDGAPKNRPTIEEAVNILTDLEAELPHEEGHKVIKKKRGKKERRMSKFRRLSTARVDVGGSTSPSGSRRASKAPSMGRSRSPSVILVSRRTSSAKGTGGGGGEPSVPGSRRVSALIQEEIERP